MGVIKDSENPLKAKRGRRLGGRRPDAVALGKRIRELRRGWNWTLEEAAQRTGLAASTICKIENDHMSPTFDVVQKLADGFEIDITRLFDCNSGLEAKGRRVVTRHGGGQLMETPVYTHRLLASELTNKRILPFRSVIKARTLDEFQDWRGHEGEEFLFVLEGEVMFHTEYYTPERLAVGDSIYIDSGMRHACVSVSEKDAVVLWINTA